MQNKKNIQHKWKDASHSHSHAYLLRSVFVTLEILKITANKCRIFDLGCGNGSIDAELNLRGWDVTGIDPSEEGILESRKAYRKLNLAVVKKPGNLPL